MPLLFAVVIRVYHSSRLGKCQPSGHMPCTSPVKLQTLKLPQSIGLSASFAKATESMAAAHVYRRPVTLQCSCLLLKHQLLSFRLGVCTRSLAPPLQVHRRMPCNWRNVPSDPCSGLFAAPCSSTPEYRRSHRESPSTRWRGAY